MSKSIYYLQFAQSVDSNDNPIPAKKLKWVTMPSMMKAWDDKELAEQERLYMQERLIKYVVRVKKAGWFKALDIRLSDMSSGDWVLLESAERGYRK